MKKNIIKHRVIKRKIVFMSLMAVFLLTMIFYPEVIYAGGLESSKLVKGTKSLITDATKVVTVLAPVLAGVMFGWNGLKLSSADDDEVRQIKKRMKTCVVGGVIGLIGGALITVLLGYYK